MLGSEDMAEFLQFDLPIQSLINLLTKETFYKSQIHMNLLVNLICELIQKQIYYCMEEKLEIIILDDQSVKAIC